MKSISSLISLLQYIRQLDLDFQAAKDTLTEPQKEGFEKRLRGLLTLADNDLAVVTNQIVGGGQDIIIGGGQDIIIG